MPWNQTTREQYKREAVRYESDLTDSEWAAVESLFPSPNRRGRPRKTDQGRTRTTSLELRVRALFDAVQYLLAIGCQWRALPSCFPPLLPFSTTSAVGGIQVPSTG